MADLRRITFAGNVSEVPETYTKTEVDRKIAVEAGDRDAADIELNARIDNIVAHGGSEVVRTLWTGDLGKKDDIITLSTGKSNFDYIDIYTMDQYFRRVPVTAGGITLEMTPTSANGSTPYLEVFNTELDLAHSDTTIKVDRTYYWSWNGSGTPSVVQDSDSLFLPIKKVDGVKYELPAELSDIRVGADGVTYPSAGDAVRGQYSQLKEDLDDNVNDLKSAISDINDIVYAFEPASIYTTASGWRLNASDGLCSSASGYKIDKYAVTAGQKLKIISDDRFQFQNSSSVPATPPNNRVGGITYGTGEYLLTVPENATYLIVSTTTSDSTASVSLATPIDKTVDVLASDLEYADSYIYKGVGQNSNNIEAIFAGTRSVKRDVDEYLYLGNLVLGVPANNDYYVYTDFIDNSADNDFTFYYDASVYRINIVRFNSSKEFLGNTGFVNIQPIRIRSYLTDPYIRIEMKRADDAMMDRDNVRLYSKRTFANSIVYSSDLSFIVKTNTITVKKDGTGDFTTIKGALASISDNSFYNRYVVEIYEGTYDLKSEYSAEWGTSGFIGCTVPPFVKLKGVGKRENIVLTAEDTTTSESLRILMATINLYQSSELENLTIMGEGLKYTVHDDFNSDKLDRYREITDVTVLGDNPLTSAIWGAGAWAGTKTKFKNCIWSSNNKIAPFYMHNNTSAEEPSYIEFENCRLKSYNTGFGDCRLLLSTANNPNHAECYCTLIGTKVRTVYMSTEGSATTIDWKVTGYGNESNGTTITKEGYASNVDLIGTASYSRYADGAY